MLIDKLKLFYPSVPVDVLESVLEDAQSYVLDYCNIEECPAGFDTLLFKMCQEDINKIGAEGYASESVAGNSTAYADDYSPGVYKRLNKHKRIRMVV